MLLSVLPATPTVKQNSGNRTIKEIVHVFMIHGIDNYWESFFKVEPVLTIDEKEGLSRCKRVLSKLCQDNEQMYSFTITLIKSFEIKDRSSIDYSQIVLLETLEEQLDPTPPLEDQWSSYTVH